MVINMKKYLFIITILIVVLFINTKEEKKEEELKAVFISYIELNNYIKNSSIKQSKENIDKMISNIEKIKLNTIILQVRSSSDAIYKSNIFPTSMYIVNNEGDNYYDVLEYFIKKAHSKNIKLYAWINPYRIRTTEDINTISNKNPAYKYLNTDTIYINNGVYYNPSKEEVTNLIVDGVKEVLNYEIDGLLFDDYFYPSNDIDIRDYNEYLENNNYIDIEKYHLNVINNMIKKVYKECKAKNIKFGISPEGNIDNNYNKNFADVKRWLKEEDYIDFIMPQVYYGFYNSSRDYISVIKEWDDLIKNDIDLYIALAFYKVGLEDEYARVGKFEWINNNNIIMKEIILSRNLKNYKGFSLFKYENIFNEDKYTSTSIKELENVKKVIN